VGSSRAARLLRRQQAAGIASTLSPRRQPPPPPPPPLATAPVLAAGVLSVIGNLLIGLGLAELASAYPTAGGVFFWAGVGVRPTRLGPHTPSTPLPQLAVPAH
jgi:amino acid transporter